MASKQYKNRIMKQKILPSALFMLALLTQQSGYAYDFEVNGIYYNVISFDEMTAGVTHDANYTPPTSHYSGDISIPATVTYNGRLFSVISVCKRAFRESKTVSVSLPNSITEISEGAFEGCKELVRVNIPDKVTTIGSYAFYGCKELKEIFIPESVTTIGSYAFSGCTNLSSVTISNGITNIPQCLFEECRNISTLTIPNSVKNMEKDAFRRCKIGTFIISPDVESFSYNYGIEVNNFYIMDSEKELMLSSYNDVIGLDSMYFGRRLNGVTCFTPKKLEIGENVSQINNVLPNNISIIRTRPLNPPIWSTKYYGYSETFSNNQFMNVPVLVPTGSISAYKSADIWKDFWNINEYSMNNNQTGKNKCEKPTILYSKGKLTFACETEGVLYHSIITNTDISSYNTNEIQLGVTYNICVYASKDNYENSDVTTATLCWIGVDPKTEGINNSVAQVRAHAVLIQARDGQITITGTDDGTKICVYEIDGHQVGSTISHNGYANLNTNIRPGNIAIIKIGDKNMKVVVK